METFHWYIVKWPIRDFCPRCFICINVIFIFSVHSIFCFIFSAHCGRPNVGESMVMVNDTNLQKFLSGTTLIFQCVTGYTPVDSSASRTITCTGHEWTELQLKCTSNSPFRYILIPHSISIFLSKCLRSFFFISALFLWVMELQMYSLWEK